MKTSGNTILITGGGSGIGRALAESFHALGNQVIIAGRRQAVLNATTRANPGMASLVLDIEDPAAIRLAAAQLLAAHPQLNVVIHNAGIMRPEKLAAADGAVAEATIATNLLGPIRLNNALLPHLLRQKDAAVMTVTSGLAFVPLAAFPTYSATKAALHSYTESLRFQLRGTSGRIDPDSHAATRCAGNPRRAREAPAFLATRRLRRLLPEAQRRRALKTPTLAAVPV